MIEVPDGSLMCRDFLHSWTHVDARRRRGGFERSLKCSRCETVKTQKLDNYGYLEGSSFKYPDNYLVKGQGRLSMADRSAIRLTNLTKESN